MTDERFRFIDLFAGIGGLRLGFERAGGKCVFTSEWNKYSQLTYRANFGSEHPIVGDIRDIDAKDVPPHDVLLAGFPCQPFSLAGVSKKNSLGRPHGFECETQGTLFFEIERVLKEHRPKAFLLENVKNLRSHDNGNTFKVIKKTLERLGYETSAEVLDAKAVVPQHRERIFIVGFRDGFHFDFKSLNIPPIADGPRLSSILHPEDGSEVPEMPYTTGSSADVSDKYTLTTNLWRYLKEYAEKHRRLGNGFGYGLVTGADTARTLSARYHKDGSEILVARGPRKTPRRLTPRECARLMGFDDKSVGRVFNIPVSDTQAYRQFGNAVVVPLVERIAMQMADRLVEPLVLAAAE